MNVFRLAVWMIERGWPIIIYCYPDSPLDRACREKNIPVRTLVSDSKWGDLKLVRLLVRQLDSDGARTIIFHVNRNFQLAVLTKRFSRSKIRLFYVQHMHMGGSRRDFFHSWLYRHLDGWIAPLPMFRTALMEKTDIPSDKIHVIPFGIELDRFSTGLPDKTAARDKLNLPADAYIAGVVGRLDPKKCQHVLVEACALLHCQNVKIHLLIVGDKSLGEEAGYAERLYQSVEQHGLTNYVHFVPHFEEIEQAYAAMDLFVLTSKSETYGMVTIEAMASGLPVIGTNDGGTVDILDDGKTGLLVEPLNVENLADAILKIHGQPELALNLARSARQVALSRYSHHNQCELLERLLGKTSTVSRPDTV